LLGLIKGEEAEAITARMGRVGATSSAGESQDDDDYEEDDNVNLPSSVGSMDDPHSPEVGSPDDPQNEDEMEEFLDQSVGEKEDQVVQRDSNIEQKEENTSNLTFDPGQADSDSGGAAKADAKNRARRLKSTSKASSSKQKAPDTNHPTQDGLTCQECGKSGFSQTTLKRHAQKVHNPLRFHCPECDKPMKTKSNLKDHLLDIHNKHPNAYPDIQATAPITPSQPNIPAREPPRKKQKQIEKKENSQRS